MPKEVRMINPADALGARPLRKTYPNVPTIAAWVDYQNGTKKTYDKIEELLDSPPRAPVIDSLLELWNCDCGFVNNIDLPGIYFIWYQEQLVYIGQTENITNRIKQHQNAKIMDCVYCIPLPYTRRRVIPGAPNKKAFQRRQLEQALIQYYKPLLNRDNFKNKPLKVWQRHLLQKEGFILNSKKLGGGNA